MNYVTARYHRYGLHAIMDYSEKQAWFDRLHGKPVPLRDLPLNGDHCLATTVDGLCGTPLLIDGTCFYVDNHSAPAEPEVTDAMVEAAYAALDAHDLDDLPGNALRALIVAVLRAQRDAS
jgi:hypothetical protein